ncbi:MAG: amino acid adenylation domain-containing protein [Aphanothece sp. CMT-3BRIN-NPC111]|jgi:amino acid adenylation domain-containing protein/non-ribosomal peptide synthase protein (TIGR01720 family)|nr:amino acid adenylation domain-containing protein [Aphanothece sp. CMT-3BRIN-NPC111]
MTLIFSDNASTDIQESLNSLEEEVFLIPASFAQCRLWFLDQFEPNSAFYNLPAAVRLTGKVNAAVLEQSFQEIVRRHESLRTTFTTVEGQPMQAIALSPNFALQVVDLRELPEADREVKAQQLVIQEAQKPFNLEQDSLLRANLLQLNEEESVLLLTMHHIVSDGWSMGVLIREVAALYKAFSAGQPSPLTDLPIQYADFALWQQEWLQGEVLETQLNYWKQQLKDAPPLLELPTDRPRPPVQTFKGATQVLVLPKSLTEALKDLSRQEDVTLFMTLLAAFKTLLSRYTGQTDILVGSPIANRNRAEIEELIGFFVNTLVLRTDLSNNPSFRELLSRVREVTLGAYQHQDLPFEKLVEELQPERSLSHNPLFQVMFQLRNAPMPALELSGLSLTLLEVEQGTTQFDLSLDMQEVAQGLKASVEYSTDLFDSATITRMLGHFQTLLEGIVADPNQPLSNLPLLTEAERHQLLVEWGSRGAGEQGREEDSRLHLCIHELFEAQVERTPDAVAVVFENQQLTYRQLNQQANQLAHYLQKLGVQPEVLVGVCIERSLEMVVAILAILKAGGAYVPLDPSYPKHRLVHMLEDSQVSVLLTQQRLLEILPQHNAKVVCLDTDWETIQALKLKTQNSKLKTQNSSNLVYVIYTSGSTGKSKGVMVQHSNLVNAYLNWEKAYQLRTTVSCHLQMASFSFDVFSGDLVRALCSGGKLVLCPRDLLLAPHRLYELMIREKIDCAEFVPVVLRNLIQYLEESGKRLEFMRLLVCGSDIWYVKEYEKFKQFCGSKIRLINSFGLTEATIDSSYFEGETANLSLEQLVPIGCPFDNTQLYILDTYLQPVPIKVTGELYIGGAGVARGYFNRPELTAEKFISNLFTDSNSGKRLYKTGDLARYLADGNIEFLCRADNQVKIRGYRIELGEIETALNQCPAVRENVVLSREDVPGEKRLVAYVVPSPQQLDVEDNLSAIAPKLEADRIAQWQTVYDNDFLNESLVDKDPTFNIGGWNNSYTGQLIPESEMREWLNNTVERILSLNPSSVLEIGCGTGLILFQIAPHCKHYCGTDFSQTALRDTQKVLAMPGYQLPQVTLCSQMADDFGKIKPETFDVVIINSVIQYFPSINYLLRVLEGAVETVSSGGYIFVGDVRSLPLLEAFHTSVQLYQAPDSLPIDQLQQRVQKRIAQEQELVIDPTFFTALKQHLPKITDVQIQPKRGLYDNELTKFRYDVILHIGEDNAIKPKIESWLDWQQQNLTLSSVHQLLEETQPEILGIRHIPNSRLAAEVKTLELLTSDSKPEMVGELREALRNIPDEEIGVNPQDFWDLCSKIFTSYSVDISWSSAERDGSYDVVFQRPITQASRQDVGAAPVNKPWHLYANNPLQEQLASDLVPHLRDYLQEKLPEYMVPSAFVMLDALPLTPNGKVDRRALPAPDRVRPELKEAFVAPLTTVEKQLTEIWLKVLGIEQVGIHDNFFELGGDSILTIQIISKANQAGLQISPKQLFQHQTIAELAAVIGTAQAMQAEQEAVTGEVFLTPIQQWFFEQNLVDLHHWNQAVLLEVRQKLDTVLLEQVVRHLLVHHDALRLRFVPAASSWQQFNAEPNAVVPFTRLDLSTLSPDEQIAAMETAATEIQASLNLEKGSIIRVALFDLGKDKPSRLLIAIHHLAVDGVSWRILLEDFEIAYQQLSRGESIQLPAKTTSFKQWAERLTKYAQSAELQQELDYWLAESRKLVSRLPLDYSEGANTVATSRTVSVKLSIEETQALLQEVPKTYRTQINDVLLTALVQAFAQWTDTLLIDLEGHGREEIFEDLDLSRTVGWFTSQFPVLLHLEDAFNPGEALKSVKEQLRSIPNRGIGYGVLRYLSGNQEITRQLRSLPQAEISFNYFGQFDQVLPEHSLFQLSQDSSGASQSWRGNRSYLLEINGFVADGQLQLDWTYSEEIHRRSTVAGWAEGFIEGLRSLIAHCQSPDTGGYTPSDFAEFQSSQWSQGDIDDILTAIGGL